MQSLLSSVSSYFNFTSYSGGPDVDLEQSPVSLQSSLDTLQPEVESTVTLPEDLWPQIVSNLSLLGSRNMCLVSRKFEVMVGKELFPLAKTMCYSFLPCFIKVEKAKITESFFTRYNPFSIQNSANYGPDPDLTDDKEFYLFTFPNLLRGPSIADRVSRKDKKDTDIIISRRWVYKKGSGSNDVIGWEFNVIKNISEINKLNFLTVLSYMNEKLKK